MKVGPYEYKNVKRLEVVYPAFDDKHEYHQPILCRARDIGKVIYGKWIIGGEQCGHFQNDSYSDEAERYFTAYKLVQGAGITCNFALDVSDAPFITKIAYPGDESRADASWDYSVNSHIDSYRPRCEPEIDGIDNGMIYIKMPSGAETKSAYNTAEKKSTDSPQIQVGDIVRVVEEVAGADKESCHVVSAVRWNEVYSDMPNFHYNTDIIAVYRFDGRDFKRIWEKKERKLHRFREILDEINKTQLTLSVKMESVIAMLAQYAKEAGDGETSKKGEQ